MIIVVMIIVVMIIVVMLYCCIDGLNRIDEEFLLTIEHSDAEDQ